MSAEKGNGKPGMRLSPVQVLVFVAFLASIAGGWLLFKKTEAGRYEATHRVAQSRSEIRLSMIERHSAGKIAEEDYRLADLNGLSQAEYRAAGRNGEVIKVELLPYETFDVSFFFDQAVVDGIWELTNKPPRGDTSTTYTIAVYQLTDNLRGSRRFTFTDPQYWATTGGHQYTLHLDRRKPVPNLLQMSSTVLVDGRYEKLVSDFENFGAKGFRDRIAAARRRLEQGT